MKKKISAPRTVKNAPRMSAEMKAEAELMVKNGLSEAVLGFNPFSFGGFGPNQGTVPWESTQVSQVTTLQKNNRWYLISNFRQLLNELYVEHGIIQTMVDVPVDDGLRGGVDIKSKQLSADQVAELIVEVEREDDLGKVAQALKWNRLFGGAGIMVITDQNPQEPLNVDAIGKDTPLEFRAVDMWELFWDKQNVEGYDAQIQEHEFEFYNYYALKVHKSRVMKLKGITPPSFIRPRLRGWGMSIVETVVRSLNQYFKSVDLVFEVLDEFKIDVYKIKNLSNTLLNPTGAQKIRQRVQLANMQKNYQNAITMDSEDDFIQKELTFAGLAETMRGIREQIACDLRMPIAKIFGISSTGFSSGEDDIENYNAMVESSVRQKAKYDILRVLELRCQKMFGFIPDDLSIQFKSLRIMTSEQEENVKTQKFNRLLAARQGGEISSEEFLDACNKDNLLSIQMDAKADPLDEGTDEDKGEKTDDDSNDSGANKEDTSKAAPPVVEKKSTLTVKETRPAKV